MTSPRGKALMCILLVIGVTSEIIKGLAQVQREPLALDAYCLDIFQARTQFCAMSCDRDYTSACPEDFVSIGLVLGGGL